MTVPDGTSKRASRTWMVRLIVLTALVFSRSLGNGFVLDDRFQIVDNKYLGDWPFIWKSLLNDSWWFRDPLHLPQGPYYRPLQNVWFALNFHLFGLNPAGWHATMILLHLIVVWLVFKVASQLSGNEWSGFFAAALFALMPVHAQAVVWPAAIGSPLSALFELSAFASYLGWFSGERSTRRLTISIGSFACALLSYDSAIAFPALIAAHAFIFSGNASNAAFDSTVAARMSRAIAATLPYALVAAAYLALRFWILGFGSLQPYPGNDLTAKVIALTIPSAIADYAILLAVPWRSGLAHRLQLVHSVIAPGFYLPFIGLAALSVAAVILLRHHPHWRLYAFCAAWMVIAIGPILSLDVIVPQAAVQDRYLYLSSFGFCLMISDLAICFARESAQRARIAQVGAAAFTILYAATLFHAEPFWRDDISWYGRCVDEAPDLAACHKGLGMARLEQGDVGGARIELEFAAKLAPEDPGTRALMAAIEHRGASR
ncbi:MAG TPA: hypothetical protein VMU16_13165 [Candidatus Binataceae bacterium]|nr:hypothetical protein [Candidatus Binataceae bacterium]